MVLCYSTFIFFFKHSDCSSLAIAYSVNEMLLHIYAWCTYALNMVQFNLLTFLKISMYCRYLCRILILISVNGVLFVALYWWHNRGNGPCGFQFQIEIHTDHYRDWFLTRRRLQAPVLSSLFRRAAVAHYHVECNIYDQYRLLMQSIIFRWR